MKLGKLVLEAGYLEKKQNIFRAMVLIYGASSCWVSRLYHRWYRPYFNITAVVRVSTTDAMWQQLLTAAYEVTYDSVM